MPQKSWRVLQLLNTTTDYLKQKGIENARLNAELLLAGVLKISRVNLYVSFEKPVSEKELTVFRNCVNRRLKDEPLQYILGQTEFMGLPFAVNPSVLIPRPETEIMVEEILKLKDNLSAPDILDIGTGSGCIAVSLACLWHSSQNYAIDISKEALQTAEQNSRINSAMKITFIQKDLFSAWPHPDLPASYDVIVSNPPYVTKAEFPVLEKQVKDFEPQIALTDNQDGLLFYNQIFELVDKKHLKTNWLFLEMSGSQPKKIVDKAKSFNFKNIDVIEDLTGIQRVLKITC